MKNLILNEFHPQFFFFFLKNVGWNLSSQTVPTFHPTLQNLYFGWQFWNRFAPTLKLGQFKRVQHFIQYRGCSTEILDTFDRKQNFKKKEKNVLDMNYKCVGWTKNVLDYMNYKCVEWKVELDQIWSNFSSNNM